MTPGGVCPRQMHPPSADRENLSLRSFPLAAISCGHENQSKSLKANSTFYITFKHFWNHFQHCDTFVAKFTFPTHSCNIRSKMFANSAVHTSGRYEGFCRSEFVIDAAPGTLNSKTPLRQTSFTSSLFQPSASMKYVSPTACQGSQSHDQERLN